MLMEIADGLAEQIRTDARQRGKSVNHYLKIIVDHAPAAFLLQRPNELDLSDWKYRFAEYEGSLPEGLPILSEEAISREVIYEDR